MRGLWIANVVAYSTQLAVLVGSALAMAALARGWNPWRRFRYWQAVFFAALLLPALGLLLKQEPIASIGSLSFSTTATPGESHAALADWRVVLGVVLAIGVTFRAAWLVVGWCLVQRLVRRATPAPHLLEDARPAGLGDRIEVRLSSEIGSPATVGWRHPVILVPPRFLELSPDARRAVLWHELLHVRRRDWAWTVLEETWCAALWFHPGARALVSRLALAREMLIDRETVVAMGSRRAYAEALLAFGRDSGAALAAPATSLIRPSQLSQRIAGIAEEVQMSSRVSLLGLSIAAVAVTSATTLTASRVPVSAGPAATEPILQERRVERPGDGVSLPRVRHEVKPQYTRAALDAKIQGSVYLAVVVEADGSVGRVHVTQSLDAEHGLDDEAVRAARQWLFDPGTKNGAAVPVEVEVQMRFTLK